MASTVQEPASSLAALISPLITGAIRAAPNARPLRACGARAMCRANRARRFDVALGGLSEIAASTINQGGDSSSGMLVVRDLRGLIGWGCCVKTALSRDNTW